jgi:EmrB/QacA subfamily drug resistance transporter
MTPIASPPRLGWILVLTSTAFFMTSLDALVVTTALPRIQESLHVGLADLQWTVNAYNIALAAGIVSAAALGDRFGRRRLFVLGLGLFTAASVACAVAPSAGILIAARALQGLGGAVILPLSLTILTESFSAERRAAVVGIYGGIAGVAVAFGPIVGGAIADGLDWHWIFWLNVPFGILAMLATPRFVPESHGPVVPLDVPGTSLSTAALTGLVWALVRGNDAGWDSAEVTAALAVGVVCLCAFLAWEARTPHPMLPLRLFALRPFAAGNLAAFSSWAAISGGAFLTTQYFQFALGYSPLETGIRLLPFFATPMVVAPIAGAVSGRFGLGPVITLGLALLGVGLGVVAVTGTLHPSYVLTVVALTAAGVGISMCLPTIPTAILGAVHPAEMGAASGTINMTQRFGAVVGIALVTSVFSAHGTLDSPASFAHGFRPGLAVAAGLAFLGALAAPLVRSEARRDVAPEPSQAAI